MKYFTEDIHDVEGYLKSLPLLEDRLDQATYQFLLNHSFHDSTINQLTVLNTEGLDELEISPVSVIIQLTYWNEQKYELRWKNVMNYSTDFDITRNKVAETGEVLFDRGLDQWAYDELALTSQDTLHHEILLFSQTIIKIECKEFSVKEII